MKGWLLGHLYILVETLNCHCDLIVRLHHVVSSREALQPARHTSGGVTKFKQRYSEATHRSLGSGPAGGSRFEAEGWRYGSKVLCRLTVAKQL